MERSKPSLERCNLRSLPKFAVSLCTEVPVLSFVNVPDSIA
jgi:hypothetical protein